MYLDRGDYRIGYNVRGDGPDLVFAHALGLHSGIWDGVISHFPNHRIITIDMRGHGESDTPTGPYPMGGLVQDAEQVLDTIGVKDCVFVGLSVGGMIAQGLAVKRLDQIRALVLSNTAAKFGQAQCWQDRARIVRNDGMAAINGAALKKWFGPKGSDSSPARVARHMLLNCEPEGYAACCEAIAGTDFYTPTSGLRIPALGIAGDRDGSTPPDLVRETIDLIPGSQFTLMRGSGHLPCLDAPTEMVRRIAKFLTDIGHV